MWCSSLERVGGDGVGVPPAAHLPKELRSHPPQERMLRPREVEYIRALVSVLPSPYKTEGIAFKFKQ